MPIPGRGTPIKPHLARVGPALPPPPTQINATESIGTADANPLISLTSDSPVMQQLSALLQGTTSVTSASFAVLPETLLVVVVGGYAQDPGSGAGGTGFTISDTLGGLSWTQLGAASGHVNNVVFGVFVAQAPAAATSGTVTVTNTAAGYPLTAQVFAIPNSTRSPVVQSISANSGVTATLAATPKRRSTVITIGASTANDLTPPAGYTTFFPTTVNYPAAYGPLYFSAAYIVGGAAAAATWTSTSGGEGAFAVELLLAEGLSESGDMADSTPSVGVNNADSGSGAETAAIGLAASESGTVVEATPSIGLAGAESGNVVDAATYAAQVNDTEQGSVADATPSIGLAGSEQESTADAASLVAAVNDTESGAVAETQQLGLNNSDASTTADATGALGLSGAESGGGTEAASIGLNDTDAGSTAEAQRIGVNDSEQGSTTDAQSIAARVNDTEAGSVAEAATVFAQVSASESLALADAAAKIGLSVAEVVQTLDATGAILLAVTDNGSGLDAGQVVFQIVTSDSLSVDDEEGGAIGLLVVELGLTTELAVVLITASQSSAFYARRTLLRWHAVSTRIDIGNELRPPVESPAWRSPRTMVAWRAVKTTTNPAWTAPRTMIR